MYPIHWAPPLSLSSLEFTLVVHLARGRDGVVAPKILERQTKWGNHSETMGNLWNPVNIYENWGNLWNSNWKSVEMCFPVFPQKSPIGRCKEGILSKADFESWIRKTICRETEYRWSPMFQAKTSHLLSSTFLPTSLSANLVTLYIDTEPYSNPSSGCPSHLPGLAHFTNACSSQNRRSHAEFPNLGVLQVPVICFPWFPPLTTISRLWEKSFRSSFLPEAPGDTYLSAWWLRHGRVQLEIEPCFSFQINGK